MTASSRLLRLLSLFQGRRYWPGPELARRLEITGRTLRRDVERLRELGYEVQSSSGVAGGYRFAAGGALPPLLLDADEAVAIAVALRLASIYAGLEEPSVRALAKLLPVLPGRLRKRAEAAQSAVTPLPGGSPPTDSGRLVALVGACRDRELMLLRYRDRDDAETEREVEPHHLVSLRGRWYLAAWDRLRKDWRTFRVDRIQSVSARRRLFAPRPAPQGGFAAYVARSVAQGPYELQARFRLHAPVEALRARIPPFVGALAPEPGRKSCSILTAGSHSPDLLCAFVAGAGVEFEVFEPEQLVLRLREIHARMRRALAASALNARRKATPKAVAASL